MYEATFELETLTPLFMRGADQRKAEFRSASVKGVMRWWFRALAGNYFGNDIRRLREAECRVFGCAGKGGTKRSAVMIEIESKNMPKNVFSRPGVFDRDSWIDKLGYLFFSIKITFKKLRNPTFYPAGSKFSITLSSPDRRAFEASVASLWTAVTLGGFGFRARRGAGNMMFTKADILEEMGLPNVPLDEEDIGNGIVKAVKLVAGVHGANGRSISGILSYPVLSPITSAVAVWERKKDSSLEVLKTFQDVYQVFRKQKSLRSRRVTLGLPIVKGNLGRELGLAAKKARRASPLIISVTPLGKDSCTLVFTKFRTEPYYHTLESREKWVEEKINNASDWEVLYQFDSNFEQRSGYPETVVYGSLEVFQ